MVYSPITSWRIDGEKVEAVVGFIFLGSKVTVDGSCSHEMKRCLLLGRKAMINLDSVLKSRGISFPTKVCTVKASSHVQTRELDHKEGWLLKNWCFQAVVLEKTLESPWYSTEIKPVNPKGNQPWVFTRRTDAEGEDSILWPPDVNSWLFGKTLILGNIRGKRRREWQRMSWLDSITDWMHMNLSKLSEIVEDREAWCAAIHGVTKTWTWLSDRTPPPATARILRHLSYVNQTFSISFICVL